MCIRVPHPGRYALLFTHDRDGKNKFNFWSDGAGFPANTKLGRRKPPLASALIDVPNGWRRRPSVPNICGGWVVSARWSKERAMRIVDVNEFYSPPAGACGPISTARCRFWPRWAMS